MGGKSIRKCEVCGVRRVRKGSSKLFLASFPLDPDRCRTWVKLAGNEDLVYLPIQRLNENKFICGKHFAPSTFNGKKTRLKRNAIPSLGLNKPLSDDLLSSFPIIPECEKAKVEEEEEEDDDDDDAPLLIFKRSNSNDDDEDMENSVSYIAVSKPKPSTAKNVLRDTQEFEQED